MINKTVSHVLEVGGEGGASNRKRKAGKTQKKYFFQYDYHRGILSLIKNNYNKSIVTSKKKLPETGGRRRNPGLFKWFPFLPLLSEKCQIGGGEKGEGKHEGKKKKGNY